ncbi:unnamed protein product [Mesocestoides corti]|uniref:BCL domain-containing protein n=1 Tax=Mesocestoides corti TaxID=53468 RepID=A0A0R3UL44_MESCO|nr:unnamed protein product [Mesocestoides corti]
MSDFNSESLFILNSFLNSSLEDVSAVNSEFPQLLSVVERLNLFVNEFRSLPNYAPTFQLVDGVFDKDIEHVLTSYSNILENLFEHVNWGRIVSMFAILQSAAKKIKANHDLQSLNKLVDLTASFIDRRLKTFIVEQGGWEGLLSLTARRNPQDSFRQNAMLCVVGAVGAIGVAGLLHFISCRI